MNCLLTYIILFLLIVLFELNNDIFSFHTIKSSNKVDKTNLIHHTDNNQCNIPSYTKAKGTYFVKDDNNYQYNHISQKKMNSLRNIKSSGQVIEKYINNFLRMDYDKYFDTFDYDKLENV